VRRAATFPAIEAEKLANRNLKNDKAGYWILDLSGAGIPYGTYGGKSQRKYVIWGAGLCCGI